MIRVTRCARPGLTGLTALAVAVSVACDGSALPSADVVEPAQPDEAERAELVQPGDAEEVARRPLSNDEYSIVEMATAHGAFTVEVEVARGADTDRIARGVVEPVKEHYTEVLVYFYDRDGDSELPILRVQWTENGGYTQIVYSDP